MVAAFGMTDDGDVAVLAKKADHKSKSQILKRREEKKRPK